MSARFPVGSLWTLEAAPASDAAPTQVRVLPGGVPGWVDFAWWQDGVVARVVPVDAQRRVLALPTDRGCIGWAVMPGAILRLPSWRFAAAFRRDEGAVMGDVWRHEVKLGPGGYTARPRNVLKPLRFGARVWVRRFDRSWHGSDDNGVRAQASRGRVGSDGVRVATVTVGVQHGHAVRSYQAGVSWPVLAGVPDRMRGCLSSPGYPLTWWERLAQDAARRWL